MRSLIDSNVLMRVIDSKPSPYGNEAVKVLGQLANDGTGVLSAQSLAEFAVHALVDQERELAWVRSQVEKLRGVFPVLPITGDVVSRALRVMAKQPLNYHDAQVWATARANGVAQVITEGLWHKTSRSRVGYYDLVRQAPTIGWFPDDWA